MTTNAPVNQRASVPAKLVEDLDGAPPGAFEFYSYGGKIADAGIIIKCPCGCPAEIAMPFKRWNETDERPVWQWDGNRERPTATPSLLIYQLAEGTGERVGEHWHGFLTAGEWISC